MNIGNIIKLGEYEWHVLNIQDDKALIISTAIIDRKAYHNINKNITWRYSNIRKYLNNNFYNAFTSEEQKQIVETSVTNNDNPKYGASGGNNTVDKIFLLSIDEYNAYKNIISNAPIWWWLRSPGYCGNFAANVGGGIADDNYDNGGCVSYNGGVRPALWLKL